MNLILNLLIRLRVFVVHFILKKPLLNSAKNPKETQWKTLSKILKKQSETEFGKKYNFSEIHSVEDFQEKVPIFEYEDLRDLIDLQRTTDRKTINDDEVNFYATTSGTTGLAKFVPITDDILEQHKESQKLISHTIFKSRPKTYDGKFLAIVSPAIEGHFDNGAPFGSVSGLVQKTVPSLIRRKYLVPYSVLEIKDSDTKYLLISLFSVAESNVTLFATANPSTVTRLLDVINENIEDLLKVLETGDLSFSSKLSKDLAGEYADYFAPKKDRAESLRKAYAKNSRLDYNDLWPNFQTLACWTKGSCAFLIPRVKNVLPKHSQIIDVGYISSEFRGTLMVDASDSGGMPTVQHNFFEFVEKDKWEEDKKEFLTIDQLKLNEKYYIFTTTVNGLYRYNINDIVEVTGFCHKTPLLNFVQKGKGVTNITGEKLYEGQVLDATYYAQETLKNEIVFFIALADPENLEYRLFIESRNPLDTNAFNELVEKKLSELNIEYATKRESKRLKEFSTLSLKPGTYEAFKNYSVQSGQREGQFKVVTLQYKNECSFSFEDWVRQ